MVQAQLFPGSLPKTKTPALNVLRMFHVAECRITYSSRVKNQDRVKVTQSLEAYEAVWPFMSNIVEHHEEFWCHLLNRQNRIVGTVKISQGGVAGTVADPKLMFQAAILANACGIILIHNHPSGNLSPSQADIDLTRKVKDAGKFIEIKVLDHIILTPEHGKYYSFADEGML
jgi:DNA repair protein RadC